MYSFAVVFFPGQNQLCEEDRNEFLSTMREIAVASSNADYDKAVADFRDSTLYNDNANVKQYAEKYWLGISKVFTV